MSHTPQHTAPTQPSRHAALTPHTPFCPCCETDRCSPTTSLCANTLTQQQQMQRLTSTSRMTPAARMRFTTMLPPAGTHAPRLQLALTDQKRGCLTIKTKCSTPPYCSVARKIQLICDSCLYDHRPTSPKLKCHTAQAGDLHARTRLGHVLKHTHTDRHKKNLPTTQRNSSQPRMYTADTCRDGTDCTVPDGVKGGSYG